MKKILIFIMLGLSATQLWGQSNFSITYAMGLPVGDVKDYISQASFRGIAADYRYNINPTMALGVGFAWHTFYDERPSDTYTIENVSLTGKQFRYSNHVPMLATATYFMEANEMFHPYATVGIGVTYTRRNTDMNLYTLEQEAWNFTLQPEIGVQIHTADLMGFVISAKYLNGFQSGSELHDPQSFFSLHVGFCFF